jgi:Glycosyl hydrolase family 79 C-terminal beta domain
MRRRTASLLGLAMIAGTGLIQPGPGPPSTPVAITRLTVERTTAGTPTPAGFLGLSLEIRSLEAYAGPDPQGVNPVLVQLIRNFLPAQRPVLRLGGDSTDWTWWPIPRLRPPPGVDYALTKRWLEIARALAAELDARLILGINLRADNARLARAEAQAMTDGIGRRWIEALELGNEPELYGTAALRQPSAPTGYRARYDFAAFAREFANIARNLPRLPLAGPSIGGPAWMPYLGRFLTQEPKVKILTLHRYPLKRCAGDAGVTIEELLSSASARGLAANVKRYSVLAHAHGVPLRVDEMNAVSCGGQRGVSDTFASALWLLDTLFQVARVGVDGVNIHTRPGSSNELFSFDRMRGSWEAVVHPEYYALLMFAQAAPPGSRQLQISGPNGGRLDVWAMRASDRHIRVVLINKDTSHGQAVNLQIRAGVRTGTLALLQAPSVTATAGVIIGGQSLGPDTSTGQLTGDSHVSSITPQGGRYDVRLPAASAAMLTVATGSS